MNLHVRPRIVNRKVRSSPLLVVFFQHFALRLTFDNDTLSETRIPLETSRRCRELDGEQRHRLLRSFAECLPHCERFCRKNVNLVRRFDTGRELAWHQCHAPSRGQSEFGSLLPSIHELSVLYDVLRQHVASGIVHTSAGIALQHESTKAQIGVRVGESRLAVCWVHIHVAILTLVWNIVL